MVAGLDAEHVIGAHVVTDPLTAAATATFLPGIAGRLDGNDPVGKLMHTLYEQAHSSDWGTPPAVPQGFAVFGADETVRKLVPAPAGAHWSEFPRGKHFPAIEAPAELAADLRVFFGPLR